MNGMTGGNRGPRRAAALAVVAAVAVLTAACGVHVHFGSSGGSASAGPPTYRANLAYAHCMQTHGVPDFPAQSIGGLQHQRAPDRQQPLGAG